MGSICQTTYQVPDDIEEVVHLLNKKHRGNVSVVCTDGQIIGEWPYPKDIIGEPSEHFSVLTGDQCMFEADTILEATAFLQGILCAVENWK